MDPGNVIVILLGGLAIVGGLLGLLGAWQDSHSKAA